MAHPYKDHKAHHHARKRAKAMHDGHEMPKKTSKHIHHDLKGSGEVSKMKLDQYARGGKVKHGKGHHTKINIIVAPKAGGDGAPPMPPMGGAAPPPMPPKAPMGGPPPGGPMGGPGPMAGGMPGIGAKPGGMKRGGKVRPKSGISSPSNLKEWANYASSNTRYKRGGAVFKDGYHGGAGGAEGRLEKVEHYGMKHKGK